MSYSPQQAAESLASADRAAARARRFQGYERASPHFFLWGAIWLLGYGLTGLYPARAGWIWLPLDIFGFAASFHLARLRRGGCDAFAPWRYALVVGAIAVFVGLTYYIMQPHDWRAYACFPPLIVALVYTMIGLFRGPRFAVTGLVLGVMTAAGFTWLTQPAALMVWLGLAGGGTLIVTGLWLRYA